MTTVLNMLLHKLFGVLLGADTQNQLTERVRTAFGKCEDHLCNGESAEGR
eukprot:gene8571-677_t